MDLRDLINIFSDVQLYVRKIQEGSSFVMNSFYFEWLCPSKYSFAHSNIWIACQPEPDFTNIITLLMGTTFSEAAKNVVVKSQKSRSWSNFFALVNEILIKIYSKQIRQVLNHDKSIKQVGIYSSPCRLLVPLNIRTFGSEGGSSRISDPGHGNSRDIKAWNKI